MRLWLPQLLWCHLVDMRQSAGLFTLDLINDAGP